MSTYSKKDYTSHFDFKGEFDSEKDGAYISEYFTAKDGTFIRLSDRHGNFNTVKKISDLELRITEVFSLFLHGEETKPYIQFEIISDNDHQIVSAPCHLLHQHTKLTAHYERAGGVISKETGRILFYTAKVASRLNYIEFVKSKNAIQPDHHDDYTSMLDLREIGNAITCYYTTRNGTYMMQIDDDGTERLKFLSDAQIQIIKQVDLKGLRGHVELSITNKHGNTKNVRVPHESLLDLAHGPGTEDYRKAGGTLANNVGEALYKVSALARNLALIDSYSALS